MDLLRAFLPFRQFTKSKGSYKSSLTPYVCHVLRRPHAKTNRHLPHISLQLGQWVLNAHGVFIGKSPNEEGRLVKTFQELAWRRAETTPFQNEILPLC